MAKKYLEKFYEDMASSDRTLREIIDKHPERASARLGLAIVLIQKRQFTDAQQLLLGVEDAYRGDDSYWGWRATNAALMGNFLEARKAIAKALQIQPDRCQGRNHADNQFTCWLQEQLFGARRLTTDRVWKKFWRGITEFWK